MRRGVAQIAVFLALAFPCLAMGQSHSVTLSWTASQPGAGPKSHPIAGYTPLRGTVSGGSYTPLTRMLVVGTKYVDTTVDPGQTYYYVVSATDTAGNVSRYSNEIVAVIPGGPLSISSSSLPGATVGVRYSAALAVSGGNPPYRCSWTGLVAGMVANSCALGGTPTVSGSYTFSVKVTDSSVPVCSATASFFGASSMPLPPVSFWVDSASPANPSGNDSQPVEVGLRFTPRVGGRLTAIRFYRAKNEKGSNTVSLWDSSGASLARAKAPKGSGWITVPLPAPVPVEARALYVASYHTSEYGWNQDFFANPLVSATLAAPANAGVFSYGDSSTFPADSYRSSNYWVDVVFVPGAPAAVRIGVGTSASAESRANNPCGDSHGTLR